MHAGDTFAIQPIESQLRLLNSMGTEEKRCASAERREDRTKDDVETNSSQLCKAIALRNSEFFDLPNEEMGQPFMRADHGFRRACATRCEHDVCSFGHDFHRYRAS
jgi:hypothetical protein